MLSIDRLGYYPAFDPFKHWFKKKKTYLKYVDPLITPHIFVYWICKDLKGYYLLMRDFLHFLWDLIISSKTIRILVAIVLSLLKEMVLDRLGYYPAFDLFKHWFKKKITYIKYVDPLITPHIFVYWICKDLKGYYLLMRDFLHFLWDLIISSKTIRILVAIVLSLLKEMVRWLIFIKRGVHWEIKWQCAFYAIIK